MVHRTGCQNEQHHAQADGRHYVAPEGHSQTSCCTVPHAQRTPIWDAHRLHGIGRPSNSRERILEITNHEATVKRLKQLIRESEKSLLIVSPFIGLDKLRNHVRDIKAALDDRKVKVTLVGRDCPKEQNFVGKSECLPELTERGASVLIVPDLHAKFYMSEKNALITSLNIVDTSMNNSIEVGVWLDAKSPEYAALKQIWSADIKPNGTEYKPDEPSDRPARAPSAGLVTQLLELATRAGSKAVQRERPRRHKAEGTCIRCGEGVTLNPDKPLCPSCFTSWNRYGDPEYRERFCHDCGDAWDTSVARPLCRDCYRSA